MANTEHFITGRHDDYSLHWERDVGYGYWPKRGPNTNDDVWSVHGANLADWWRGNNTDPGGGNRGRIEHWDGVTRAFTSYNFPGSSNEGQVIIHTGGPDYPNEIWAGLNESGSPWARVAYYDVNTDSFVNRANFTAQGGCCPFVVSDSLVYLVFNGLVGPVGFRTRLCRSVNRGVLEYHPEGLGLPAGFKLSVVAAPDGTIYVLGGGNVYRGTWGGTWTIDNATHGPFLSGSDITRRMCIDPVTGTIHVADTSGGNYRYYRRNGPDDWMLIDLEAQLGAMSGSPPEISAYNGVIIITFSGSKCYSLDDGVTWQTTYFSTSGRGAWAFSDEASSGKRLCACYLGTSGSKDSIWWRGDQKDSPWSRLPAAYRKSFGFSTDKYCLYGLPTGQLMLGVNISGATPPQIYHWNQDDGWSVGYNLVANPARIFATEFKAGRIHAVGTSAAGMHYYRWNETEDGYDETIIPGSSQGTTQPNLCASNDGQEIWIAVGLAPVAQLWHSTDGGVTWVDEFANAVAAAGGGNWPHDVVMVSPSEVHVVMDRGGAGTYHAIWNGSSWAVGQNLAIAYGCYYKALTVIDGVVWLAFSGNNSPFYKWTGSAWDATGLGTKPGTDNLRGFAGMPGLAVIATAGNLLDCTHSIDEGAEFLDVLGLSQTFAWRDMAYVDLGPYGGGGKLAYRCGDGREPHRYAGQMDDGSMQSDLLISTGVQNIITFDGGQLED